ncbi:hydrogenase expression/formation protein HypE [Synechococcus sp. RSCCF101]|uniref:hydrogenase expression/formation protein HypE n=1 Tax=Synechococcus sp. RSCCF101 TaxID=2511069 RepID=UPI00124427BE|nr:hydrogenase expression/formation protein HypE [Synechococcus sp. RSCCF101]QEY33064.1 hydrogenase expression/formation protein HypE [Synechococcus sp. RSCCF101]
MSECIRLAHGGGGQLMRQLIAEEFRPLHGGGSPLHDAATIEPPGGRLAFTTDGYVVQPLEFPGGDIGRLAVTGTANDLAMAGARPLHLSVAMVLEEGLPLAQLRRIVASMAAAARECGVVIRTGDTKVVERGKGDGLFITTSGVGQVEASRPIGPGSIRPGDRLVVSGDLGRHGLAILAIRHGLELEPPVASDCAPLWPAVERLLQAGVHPHLLRDLTRGGLAAVLQELAEDSGCPFRIEEGALPLHPAVERVCDLLGLDPLQLANEGRFLLVVAPDQLEAAMAVLGPEGGVCIGEVGRPAEAGPVPDVVLRTPYGTQRCLPPVSGELLPRIC